MRVNCILERTLRVGQLYRRARCFAERPTQSKGDPLQTRQILVRQPVGCCAWANMLHLISVIKLFFHLQKFTWDLQTGLAPKGDPANTLSLVAASWIHLGSRPNFGAPLLALVVSHGKQTWFPQDVGKLVSPRFCFCLFAGISR